MRLDPSGRIAGHPAGAIRDFLRRAREFTWSAAYLSERLDLSRKAAERTIRALLAARLIEPDATGAGEFYRVTTQGRAVALATLAAPLHRKTAERKLSEFLGRVERVNRDPYYLYHVEKVTLFGSMLTTAPRVSDVDLAIDLAPKEEDSARRRTVEDQRIGEALRAGRRFSNIIAELSWPRTEVLLFLKSRSRALSFHDPDDGVLDDCDQRVVFERQAGGDARG